MSDYSDSLRASSSTQGTPYTDSSSDGAQARGRVNVLRGREGSGASSLPSFPVIVEVGRGGRYPPANATPKNRQESPKRPLEKYPTERYHPTILTDVIGNVIYFDPSLPGKWRVLKSGQAASTPASMKEGGEYYGLPTPPGYEPQQVRDRKEELLGKTRLVSSAQAAPVVLDAPSTPKSSARPPMGSRDVSPSVRIGVEGFGPMSNVSIDNALNARIAMAKLSQDLMAEKIKKAKVDNAASEDALKAALQREREESDELIARQLAADEARRQGNVGNVELAMKEREIASLKVECKLLEEHHPQWKQN